MKHYIKVLLDYEESNNSFDLLCNFIALRKSDLLDSYCTGKINLPSFILLKKLKTKYIDLANSDEELNALLEKAISCSKIFYTRTLKIISAEGNKFDNLFSKQVQPIGQQLINVLINIKFRVRLIRLNRVSPKQIGVMRIIEKIKALIAPPRIALNSILYKLSLFQTAHTKYTNIIYIISILCMLFILLIANNYLINDLPVIQTTGLNITFCILITVSSILFYPFRHFSKIDINGQDIIAYKYRLFFNNTSNKKMYRIFALEHSNISRQQISPSIDSL